jgi:hypothetical protein
VGQQDKTGVWDCPNTGGLGTYAPNCHMTPQQIRDWGKVLAPAGCTLLAWRYDAAFMARAGESGGTLRRGGGRLAASPERLRQLARSESPADPGVHRKSCSQLTCNFTDNSTDRDGRIAVWSWDFGDGTTSSTPSSRVTPTRPPARIR